MALSEPQVVELTRRYQRELVRLSTASETQLQTIWDHLGSWDDVDVDRFLTRAAPVTQGTLIRAGALAAGYLGLLVGVSFAVDTSHLFDDIDFRSPFIGYWKAIKDGQPWEQAITTGRTRAETLARTAANTAARAASAQIDQQAPPHITGWRRVLTGPSSCEFCALISTQRYQSAETAGASNHGGRCDCTVAPIIGTHDPGRVINGPLLSKLKNLGDQATGYVHADGTPAARPDAAPVTAPQI